MSALDRILIGTVQLVTAYGRRAQGSPPDRAVAERVFDAVWAAGVRAFDTAVAYGTAAAVAPFQGIARLTLLSHGACTAPEFSAIRRFAARHDIACGQSVYTVDEVRAAAALGADRVQVPGNVLGFDAVDAAQRAGVPCDIRSVFLQRVLLDTPAVAERLLQGAGMLVRKLYRCAADAGLPIAVALLAAVLRYLRAADRVVVGVDEPDQVVRFAEVVHAPANAVAAFIVAVKAAVPVSEYWMWNPHAWSATT